MCKENEGVATSGTESCRGASLPNFQACKSDGLACHSLQAPSVFEHQWPLQFCQWTIASAPQQPLLVHAIDTLVAQFIHSQRWKISRAALTRKHILWSAGPAIWTFAIATWLSQQGHDVLELAMQSPTVVEGVGILGQQVRGLSLCFQKCWRLLGWRAGTLLVWSAQKAWHFASCQRLGAHCLALGMSSEWLQAFGYSPGGQCPESYPFKQLVTPDSPQLVAHHFASSWKAGVN